MAEGYSLTAFAGHIGVSRDAIDHWQQDHPEFRVAVARARPMRVLAWEQDARNIAKGAGGSAPMIMFALKNMAPEEWRDRQEVAFTDTMPDDPARIAADLLRGMRVAQRIVDADRAA